MREVFILDACALVALLKQEKGADIVADIFLKARYGIVQLHMNRINLLEVYYGFYGEKGEAYALNYNGQRNSDKKITPLIGPYVSD